MNKMQTGTGGRRAEDSSVNCLFKPPSQPKTTRLVSVAASQQEGPPGSNPHWMEGGSHPGVPP